MLSEPQSRHRTKLLIIAALITPPTEEVERSFALIKLIYTRFKTGFLVIR